MSDEVPLSSREMRAIQEKLNGNALLASLIMTSPTEAFSYLGFDFSPRDFDISPPTAEDAKLAKHLRSSLESGQTKLETPHVLQPAADQSLLKPSVPQKKSARPADITLSVSKATLQHVLEGYVESNFKDQSFDLPTQDWWEIEAVGQNITLDLTQEQALIVASLAGTVSFSLQLLGFTLYEWKTEFPIEIKVLAAFTTDDNDQLYLNVRQGDISLTNAPFPAQLTADLIEKITDMVPYIPLIRVPTKFELPDTSQYATAEADLRLTNIAIDEKAIHLEFQLEESPRS